MQSLYYIIIFGFYLHYAYTANSSGDIIHCNPSDPLTENNQIQYLGLNTTYVVQDTCVTYFELNLQNTLFENKFLIVEVYFANSSQVPDLAPIFAEKTDELPVLSNQSTMSSDTHSNQVIIDYNAYINHKTYANIVLSPQNISQSSYAYFAVYITRPNNVNITLEYDIKVSSSNDFPCPQSCSSEGECDQIQQKCICNTGFFDLDCSVQAVLLTENMPMNLSLDIDEWKYLYLPQDEFTEGSYLKIENPEDSSIYVLTSFNAYGDYNLVNFENAQEEFYLLDDDNIIVNLTVPQEDLLHSDGQILIALYNSPDSKAITLTIQLENPNSFEEDLPIVNSSPTTTATALYYEEDSSSSSSSSSSSTKFIFIIAALIIAFCFCATCLKAFKVRRDLRQTTIEMPHDQVGHQEPLQAVNSDNELTKEDFQRYFPKKKYGELKDPYTHQTCSVCLDEFEDDVECHQLYCKHVFHVDCIEAWLARHYSCPNCNKSMTKRAIEDFLKAEEQKKEVKEEASLILIEDKKEVQEDGFVVQMKEGNASTKLENE